jgi:hypothetical protein
MRTHPLFPGDDTNTVILSGIENCAGILCACLPTMLPIWNYLHRGRTQSSARTYKFTPKSGRFPGPKALNMEASLWSDGGKHDPDVTSQDGPFQRLQDEGVAGLNDPRPQGALPMAIRVTTDIETSRKMSYLESNNSTIGPRQPEW